MRRLRIVSDGSPGGTRLLDDATGEDLNLPIMKIVWTCHADRMATAEVTLHCPLAKLVAETYIGGKNERKDGPLREET